MTTSKLTYRAEIDGLRAIAVVSVILYHAQMVLFGTDWFEGGFIGVDIFFVISGYLIARIIFSELQSKGSFSFLNFYERRARRILPMLFVVIFVSIPYAWQTLLPSDFTEYAKSVFASLFFGSNFFFYFSTTEYGADSALLKPFLHTWSLGVEEQFYLAFPILAIVAFRFFRKHVLTILLGLSLVSLLFAEMMEVRNSDLNFYLPFSRFWELAAGSILAYRELNYKSLDARIAVKTLPMLGLVMIAYSILFFDSNTPHPSFHTLLPIIGVALIIGFATKDELVGKVLGSKPFVWVGLVSYSAYLWHFPIFAFSRMGNEPTNFDKFEWLTLTLVLSVLSYFLVEMPFRKSDLIRRKFLFIVFGLATVFVSSLMFYANNSDRLWKRHSRVQQELIKGFDTPEYRGLVHPLGSKGTHLRSNTLTVSCNMRFPSEACRYGNEKLVFLGDSYVGQYERAFIDVFRLGFISFNYEQCPFVSDQIWFGSVAECSYVNEERRRIIQSFSEPKVFVVSANYRLLYDPKQRVEDPISAGRARRSYGDKVSPSEAWISYWTNIEWLVNKGHKVILIRMKPDAITDGSKWLGANLKYIQQMNFPNVFNDSKPSIIKEIDDKRFRPMDTSSVLVVDPVDSLCNLKLDVCMDVLENFGPLFNGGNHLSYLGSTLVAESIKPELLERGWISQ